VEERLEHIRVVLLVQQALVAVARLARLVEITLAQMELPIQVAVVVALRIKTAQPQHLGMVVLEL
jgi:hypothetical protein